jgi:sugar phosphate isomerase/epimerase
MSGPPKVGLDAYSLTGPTGLEICQRGDVLGMLRKVRELGGEGLQAPVPDDPAGIRDAFALADELGLYLEPYVHLPIHWRGDADLDSRRAEKLRLLCRVCAERGLRAMHCTMGARERFEDPARWKQHVAATAASVREWAPVLREHGVRIGIENHWDYTTYEIVGIAEQAGADVVGVGLDTGNLPILGEPPDAGLERSLQYVVTTHLKDVYLISTPTGANRPIVPLGQGQVGMAAAVRRLRAANPALHFTIEDHPVMYPVDYFERWWLDAVPELTSHDIAAISRLAREGDRWLHEHLVPDPHAAELVPWSIRGPARLAADIAAVKGWLRTTQEETTTA